MNTTKWQEYYKNQANKQFINQLKYNRINQQMLENRRALNAHLSGCELLTETAPSELESGNKLNQQIFLHFLLRMLILCLLCFIIITPIYLTGQAPRQTLSSSENQDKIKMQGFKVLLSLTFWSQIKEDQNSWKFIGKEWYADIGVQGLLVIGLIFMEYAMFRVKSKGKGKYIQDYSLQIRNLPILPSYILQPKLQHFLTCKLREEHLLLNESDEYIEDISCSYGQQISATEILQEKLKKTEKNSDRPFLENGQECIIQKQDQMRKFLAKIQISTTPQHNTAWVTFKNRKYRYLAYRLLLAKVEFLGHQIKVAKAPHPLQIRWNSLYQPRYHQILSKVLGIFIFIVILLIFDLIILYIYRLDNNIVGSLSVVILEIVLKEIVLVINKIERHKTDSSFQLSLFDKLTKYLYINTGLIIFISSYDFGDFPIFQFFSSSSYSHLSVDWYESVGVSIILTALFQLIYVNIRLFIEWGKKKLFDKFLDHPNKKKLSPDLDICYAHLISVLMVFNTYTFTHPILYLMSFLVCLTAYFSHRRIFKKYSSSPTYNNNRINYGAIQYLLISVCVHFVIVFLLIGKILAIILAGSIAIFLLLKNTIYSRFLQVCRQKVGPLCFVSYETHQINEDIIESMGVQQIERKIKWLGLKIMIGEDEYLREHSSCNYIQKGYLDRYSNSLRARIQILTEMKNKKTDKQSERDRLLGAATYSLPVFC